MTDREVLVDNRPHSIRVLERDDTIFLLQVDKKTVTVRTGNPTQDGRATVEINGRPFQVKIEKTEGGALKVKVGRKTFEVRHQPKTSRASANRLEPAPTLRRPIVKSAIEKDAVVAPIAGRITLLKAELGQGVEKGECICVLEAMKMENEITAPKAGVLKEIKVSEGDTVNKGEVLVVIA